MKRTARASGSGRSARSGGGACKPISAETLRV